MRSRLSLFLAAGLAFALAQPSVAQTKLLRFPDLHGDRVVFSYGGDLWTAALSGGLATRLTSHPGVELFAKFSPDGKQVAFTSQFDGDEQVYVMASQGGEPKQLTFYPAAGPLPTRWGYDNQVYEWFGGDQILYRSNRDSYEVSQPNLFLISTAGGLPSPLPMPTAGAGDVSENGQVVYSPLFRDFRHWKRYEGGWAQNLYFFDLKTKKSERITDHKRTERDPMWIGDKVYFSADWDGKLNLYSYEPATKKSTQLTFEKTWDVRWPSADKSGRRIVYELGGELQVFDIASGKSRPIAIQVPTDGLARRAKRVSAGDAVTSYSLSPEGKRVAFSARGELFTAPAENGPTRNLTLTTKALEDEPAWSPDGKTVAFVSDRDGEEEIYLIDQVGGEPRQMTDGSVGRFANLVFSPDSSKIAFQNQDSKLLMLDIASKKIIEIADDAAKFGLSFSWSPCSTFIAYSTTDANEQRSLHIWSAADGKSRRVTDELWSEYAPVFDPQGNYLFYLSDREFPPMIGSFEFDYAVDRETVIYALALRKDVANLFAPKSDEVTIKAEDTKKAPEAQKEDGKKDAAKKEGGTQDEKPEIKKPIVIDFDGLAERVTRVPVEADNFGGLVALEGRLLYVKTSPFFYGRAAAGEAELRAFALADRKESTLATGIQGFSLAPDNSKILIGTSSGFQILDPAVGKDSLKPVSTAGLKVDVVPTDEWAHIFDDAWRYFRDYFYVDNLHGYDWKALKTQYQPLLAHVAHRSDLNYLISEMIAELNVSHAYVAGGDMGAPTRPRGALLGGRLELDAAAKRYRISKIFAGHNQEEEYRSPLTEVGVNVKVGDYLLAINGEDLGAADNPDEILRRADHEQLELLVNSAATTEGARKVMIRPLRNEDGLIYLEWVERNRRYVAEKSNGRLGYLHIPDMGNDGIREFIKWFYGQVRKDGMVVDVRSNGGGNVSQMILQRLQRKLLMVDWERHSEISQTYPGVVFDGHLAALLDEDTASDGDQFSYVFKAAGLGPLIGKRSWGGVVGIYGSYQLMDGGGVSVPEVGSGDPEGRWVIEGHGVDPDIVVDNDPGDLLAGKDAQLDTAIAYLMDKIAKEPRKLPARPSPPVKTR